MKKIGKSYYLYHSTTVWVKEEGRRKVSNYIGRISEKGVVTRAKRARYVQSIYEYGRYYLR